MKSLFTTIALTVASILAVAGTPIGNSPTALITSRDAVSGMQFCGIFAPAHGPMAGDLIAKLGQGDLKDRVYTTAAGGCNRVQCWDTSGVYVCNVRTF